VSACADAEAVIELLTSASTSISSSRGDVKYNNTPIKLPSVIICDVRMPKTGMDGLELLDLLKNPDSSKVKVTSPSSDLDFVRQQWKRIPVIMLTAKSLTQDRIEGYRKGADVYLPKPFAPEELLSIVDNVIGRMKALSGTPDGTSTLRNVKADVMEIKSMLQASDGKQYQGTKYFINPKGLNNGNNQAATFVSFSSPFPMRRLEQANASAIVPRNRKNDSFRVDYDLDEMRRNVKVTNIEKEVLELLSEGNTNGEIATIMGFTTAKVSRLISSMYLKTFTKTRTELVRWALEMGYISAT
jgi:DNA-binding NarL/FixJ family response regulator